MTVGLNDKYWRFVKSRDRGTGFKQPTSTPRVFWRYITKYIGANYVLFLMCRY